MDPRAGAQLNTRGDHGYALLAVIGVLAVLSVIAVSLSQRARIGVSGATAFLEETRDHYAIEAGVTLAIRAVFDEPEFDDQGQMALDLVTEGRTLTIVVIDESRNVDINRASSAALARSFTALGSDRNDADALAQRVIDWRDADDRRQQNGAEADDYLAAGILAIPRNMPFVSLDEVETVLGVPAEIARRLHERFSLMPPARTEGVSFVAEDGSIVRPTSDHYMAADNSPSSDGITRRADAISGPRVLGALLRLQRDLGGAFPVYFRHVVLGGT